MKEIIYISYSKTNPSQGGFLGNFSNNSLMKKLINIIKETHKADPTYFVDFFMLIAMAVLGSVTFVWFILNFCR